MNMEYDSSGLTGLDRFTRANLINSLSGYKPVSLIATCDSRGNTNLAIFSNIVHLGADPALVGFINRPREAAPHTLANIEATGLYTINHIHGDLVQQAHQTSAKYPEGVSEFEACGFTPEYTTGVSVPYVRESRVRYRLRLVEVIPILHNNTFLVIGTIEHLEFPAAIVDADGFLHLDQAGSQVSLGIDGYAAVGPVSRFPYARP
ncbi:MAG: flavin reductase family protein [Sphingobacteriales bacterium]|jgi:flavin reductase (DIM6/NTAB) family NADH-FMN oxidoreductase RutF|nr:flavin reductase family protein [Sphingobacteriales bacterium]